MVNTDIRCPAHRYEDLTPNQLGKHLNNFGISSQKRHQPGGPDQRGWKIRAGEQWTAPWLDAFVRYGTIQP